MLGLMAHLIAGDGFEYGLWPEFLSYTKIGSRDQSLKSVQCEHVLHSTM